MIGKSIKQKIDLVIARMEEVGADQFVVTSLDEIACKSFETDQRYI